MNNAQPLVCLVTLLLIRFLHGSSITRELASKDEVHVDLTKSLTKRHPYLDPESQDVHVLWESEDEPAFDPENHGVYVLFDNEDSPDLKAKRSLYNIVRKAHFRAPGPGNRGGGGRRSLYNIVKNLRPKKRPGLKKVPVSQRQPVPNSEKGGLEPPALQNVVEDIKDSLKKENDSDTVGKEDDIVGKENDIVGKEVDGK